MKLTIWIGALLLVALLALLLGRGFDRTSAIEARAKIVALEGVSGLQLVRVQKWTGDAVLGSKIEKKLRELLGASKREAPFEMEDYHFRGLSGEFIVQLYDVRGEPCKVRVYGGPEESTEVGSLLREAIPEARPHP